MNDYAIELDQIQANYGLDQILKDYSMRIPRGTIQGIIGPSGAGKTTVIKIINGLKKAQQGTVKIFNRELNKHSLQELRPQIGYIPQNMGLIHLLTAKENVIIGGLARIGTLRSIFKFFPKNEIEKADHLLEILGLTSKADIPVFKLSGGEKRRIAIARALMQEPKILLADEILSDLDFIRANFIMEKIKQLKDELSLTVVMVEHNLCNAREFSDQVAFLADGKIQNNLNKQELGEGSLCKLFQ